MTLPPISSVGLGAEFQIAPIEAPAGTDAPKTGGADFGEMLTGQLGKIADLQRESAQQSQALATGQATDVSEVVMAVERASLGLTLASQVRNKAVEAYQEIFRMQV